MRPVLLEVAGVSIPSYGATLVAMFVIGFVLFRWRAAANGVVLDNEHLLNLAVIACATILGWVVAGMLLAALGLAGSAHINGMPILALGAFAFLAYMRRAGLPAEQLFDIVAPIAALGLAVQFGIGTWLAGTAFGKPTALPWGVTFPADSPAFRVYGAVPLHPTQLYLGFSMLVLALAAWFVPLRVRQGQRALFVFIAIACVYLLISPLRGNTSSFLAGQAPRLSEMVAVFVIVFCAVMAWRRREGSEAAG